MTVVHLVVSTVVHLEQYSVEMMASKWVAEWVLLLVEKKVENLVD